MRELLAGLEAGLSPGGESEAWPALAYVAGRGIELDDEERRAALRRALLLLAAGGDVQRRLDLDGRAVTSLAAELGDEARRAALARGLEALRAEAGEFPRVCEALDALVALPELAWRAYACALLAEELGD